MFCLWFILSTFYVYTHPFMESLKREKKNCMENLATMVRSCNENFVWRVWNHIWLLDMVAKKGQHGHHLVCRVVTSLSNSNHPSSFSVCIFKLTTEWDIAVGVFLNGHLPVDPPVWVEDVRVLVEIRVMVDCVDVENHLIANFSQLIFGD